jgi:hypothetical protein
LVPAADGSDEKVTKIDPRHDNGREKLFMEQPETDYASINKEIKDAEDMHVSDGLTKAQILQNEQNLHRAQVLEFGIDLLPEAGKIPNRPYYRMSKTELEELKRQIEKYLDAGMIEASTSPYGAACLFAPKKNGKLRFCIDYRPLNNITKKNAATQPAPDDCLNQMAGCKIFSCVDLAQGYHQIPIKMEDREKTAFNTKYGHYQWKVLPFGLTNAPATFVTGLNKIFSGEAFRAGMATAQGPHADRIKAMSKEEIADMSENLLDKFLTIFVDDCIIYSKDAAEHAVHLRRVFKRLREYGIYIQSSKAFYAQAEVEFLGHLVNADGVKMQDDKVSTVRDWPTPENVSHIRQFLGLSGYYRKFIKGYAQVAKPMSDLTKKTTAEFEWNPEAEEAFQKLKELMTSAPVLAIPDTARGKFHLNTDACDFGIGATLSQEGADGKLHPCAFASRVLKPSEVRAYRKTKCVYSLELEALVYSLQKWRFYLEGQIETQVQTDHKSLIWLQTQPELTMAQSKFLDILARFDLRIEYLKGELNVPGDVPSRNPRFKRLVDQYVTDVRLDEYEEMRQQVIKLKNEIATLMAHPINPDLPMAEQQKVAKAKRKCRASIALCVQRMQAHNRAKLYAIRLKPESGKRQAWLNRIMEAYKTDPKYKDRIEDASFHKLVSAEIELWYHTTTGDDNPPAVCVPDTPLIKEVILKEFHMPPTIGHYNGEDMYSKMKRCYYWPGMRQECLKYAKCCKICQPHKPHLQKPLGYAADADIPIRPWSSVSLDFFGPFKMNKKTGHDSILVVVDRLTKMAHFMPCSTKVKAPEVADLLLNNMIRHHGLADDYRSDRDKIFTSQVWETIWGKLGTSLSLGTAYHHQTAGQAERVNQELRRYLSIYCKSHADWEDHITLAEFAYNAHKNSSTGCTPFELNKGYQPRNPNELLAPQPNESKDKRRKLDAGEQWLDKLANYWLTAQTKLRQTFNRYEKWSNKTRSDVKDIFPVGSRAYLSTRELQNLSTIGRETEEGMDEHAKRKLLPFYMGPYEVLEVTGKNNLNRKLELPLTLKERLKSDIFHIEKLKPVGEREEPFSESETLPPPKHLNGEFYVEKILAFEQRAQGKRYLVKWEGYPSEKNTWEWEWDVENAQERIADFFKTKPTEKNPVRRSGRKRNVLLANFSPIKVITKEM